MTLMDMLTHFSILRRKRRGIRPAELIKDVFESGIAAGAIVALLLNLILPGRAPSVDHLADHQVSIH